MRGKYWEEWKVGERFVTPRRTVTETHIALCLGIGGDSNPLFTDEEFAKETIYKGRIAPGVLHLVMWDGLVELTGLFAGTAIALLGFENVRFTAPVRAGDTLTCEGEVIEKRETKKPGRGIVKIKTICKNQKNEQVFELVFFELFQKKP